MGFKTHRKFKILVQNILNKLMNKRINKETLLPEDFKKIEREKTEKRKEQGNREGTDSKIIFYTPLT